MDCLRNALESQRSLLVVITATLAGVSYPGLATPLQPIVPALVVGLVFTAFYGLEIGDVAPRRLSRPVIASLACLYLLVPVALYPIAGVVLTGEILLGVLVVLSAPLAAGSSLIWTRLGGGNTLLTTITVLASMLLAPLVMPSIITVFADSAVEISGTELFVDLAAIIVAAGVLASLVPDGSVSEERLDTFSLATIGALIYVGVGGSTLAVETRQLAFAGGIGVATIGLSAGVAYALYVRGMRSDDCVTVLFSSSMKNMSVSVMVGTVFGGGAIVASITAFYVAQQLVSSSLVRYLESAASTRPSEAVTSGQLGD